MNDQQQQSVVRTLATIGDHLQSIADLARTLRGRNAKAIVSEARQAAELLGMPLDTNARFAAASAAQPRVAIGAGIQRRQGEAGMVQP